MAHDLRPFHAHQGWAIDDTHPSCDILNVSNILEHLINACSKPSVADQLKKCWIRDVETYAQAHSAQIMQSAAFRRAPIAVVQRFLSLPALDACEDDVLDHVIQYAMESTGVRTDAPNLWTAEEKRQIMPLLEQLLPYIRIFSLSTGKFLRVVEPLDALSNAQLVDKYRFDALARQLQTGPLRSSDGHTFATIKRCYKEAETRRDILHTRLRGLVAVSESSHPYYKGEEEILEEVNTVSWAPRVLVEFDRRSCIGRGAKLTFYADQDATQVLACWHEFWASDRRGVKTWVLNGHRFFVGFRSSSDEKPKWGWKLIATPIFDAQDFEAGHISML